MSALICGSFAFDSIMTFKDRFKQHILPDKLHILNVSFLVPEMRREYGGCAGNIAYNLNLLGENALPMGTVGKDFAFYAQWMDKCGIPRSHVTVIEHTYTAQAFITTDLDDNQITLFHPGAMNFSHHNRVTDAIGVTIGMVSPDGREGMIEHAKQFADRNIPFIFDPGQGMPLFDGNDLIQFINQATWVIVNDYEWELLQARTKLTVEQVVQQVKALIITKGAKGSVIYVADKVLQIPPVSPKTVTDPTGCGDAFRGGLLYGLMNELDWETTGRIASLMGTIKIEQYGTQNHEFTLPAFQQRFEESFGMTLRLPNA